MHVNPLVVYGLIVLIGLLPLLVELLSGFIADCAKCALNEGSTNPCLVAERDIGPLLYGMFVSGWFAMLMASAYTAYLLLKH
jgi:hypothetical protein